MSTFTQPMPRRDQMMTAFLERDPAWDELFCTGVVTTGIFFRPICPARKPRPETLRFFSTAR